MKEQKIKTKGATPQVKKTSGRVDSLGRDVWFHMKKAHGLTDTRMLQLKTATCPAKVDGMAATLVRIFEPDVAKEKGVAIKDYESLNEHPELVLYEGYKTQGRGSKFITEERNGAGPSMLARKLNEGAITDVGVTIPKTGARKWLGRFGTS